MFEHATLQEAYTGALIAGKGKALNNIGVILERAKVKHEDWARVRFGAGTPWRRCWCVITPPDEKEVLKLQKQANKKKSAYDKTRLPVLRGDVKFYDTKKTKKMQPIATVTDAYSAFAIYPQSKPLIDASTLIKMEGVITIHSNPPSTTEGFVFVMPEVHPAVSGFEMMLRWLFPVYDTFALYGRPGRLIADTLDPQSLMFAMPKHRRYGYLEILDVTGLIVEQGSATWRESEWRRRMKELTKKRMTAIESGSHANSRYSSRRSARNSFGPSRTRLQFDDEASVRSSPSTSWGPPNPNDVLNPLPRTDSAPAIAGTFNPSRQVGTHHRSVSETQGLDRYGNESPVSAYDGPYEQAPIPPPHAIGVNSNNPGSGLRYPLDLSVPDRNSSEDDRSARATPVRELQELQATSTPEPVAAPPAFNHGPGAKPISKPYHSPELRRANSRMSNATLSQMTGASGTAAAIAAQGEMGRTSEDHGRQNVSSHTEDRSQRGVPQNANTPVDFLANQRGMNEGLVASNNQRFSFDKSSASQLSNFDSRAQYSPPPRLDSLNSAHAIPQSNDQPPPPPMHNANPSPPRTYNPPGIFPSPERTVQDTRYQGHNPQKSADSTTSTISQSQYPNNLQTSQSILRKPLPTRTATLKTQSSEDDANSPSDTGSLINHVIDQDAFDMIGLDHRTQTLRSENQIHRQNSDASIYEDNASTASPDYASTRPSIDSRKSQKSVERPRAGVKKTVGNPESNLSQMENARMSIPNIDFGPTINYAAERPPIRSHSPGVAQSYSSDRSRSGGTSPGPAMNNYPPDRAPRHNSQSGRPESAGGRTRYESRSTITPETAHYRNSSAESRTLAWQPGMAISGSPAQAPQSITAEQFVAQRAAAATATPQYAHQRQSSSNALSRTTVGRATPDRNSTTPPLARNRSSDYLTQQGHSRNSSTDMLARPSSRGAGATLSPAAAAEASSKLSAREQEHIARATGQPLISVANNNKRLSMHQPGLVGAIEAREIEKQQIKQGINSQAVENAIHKRQQQQHYEQQQQYHQQQQMQAAYRQPQSYNMGQFPQQQYPVQGQQYPAHLQQQQFQMQGQSPGWGASPAANVFAQGGGWTQSPGYAQPSPGYSQQSPAGRQSPGYPQPSPGFTPQSQAGRQSPGRFPPQQQYFPPQGQGRGNQGHGY
jgi:CCR4-NOT transcriptional complex subunit CAF120